MRYIGNHFYKHLDPNKLVEGSKSVISLLHNYSPETTQKDDIPKGYQDKFEDWMFGCDICLNVCPRNRFSKTHNEPLFNLHLDLLEYDKKEWEEVTKDVFN
jgi:epoxyqueuosine reductase QueG